MIKQKILATCCLLCLFSVSQAQLCGTNPVPNAVVDMFCGQSCFTYTTNVADMRSTEDYSVSTIPYNFFPYSASGTALTSIYIDDKFSAGIEMPFPFCFYGQTYSSLVIGSNGVVTFDITTANQSNAYPLLVNSVAQPIPYAGGTQNVISPAYYPKASIMGAYHDIDPSVTSSPNRRIEWLVAGQAPCRMFIVNYYQVPMFSSSCNSQLATHQIILYETTGAIDVNITNKPLCSSWNGGLAILGVQNFARDKAVAAPGKNATQWSSQNESYRFSGAGATSLLVKAELVKSGTVVSTAATAPVPNNTVQLNFPQVCQPEDSITYKLRLTYGACNVNNPNQVVVESDVKVRKTAASNLSATVTATDGSCTNPTGGSVIAAGSNGLTPYSYSLNNGAFQSSGTFTGLAQGTYQVRIRDAGSCEITRTATVGFNNDITLQSRPDTSFCTGASVRMNTTSNAAQFSWTPANTLSAGNIREPVASPTQTTTYVVTATLNGCEKKDTVVVTVLPTPSVNAGTDKTVIAGDAVLLADATASLPLNSIAWSPSAGLSATNIMNPVAQPTQTTTYTLTVTNSFGCPAQDNVVVTVIPYCVNVIKAFTPNGDGLHDRWVVTTGGCIDRIKARVYNRYGGLIFSDDNYKNDWDGTYKGNKVPDGTYYYTLDMVLISGRRVLLKGDVTILR